ncbi:MAG: class I SAM-dependent methyltransferase family protein [Candidatus Altiarchaeota archaeon]|nr:class I SAM-dependent methyltransferase family protein [Candidatus Altiarchaeota archaeon]
MDSLYVKVKRKVAEEARIGLLKKGAFDNGRRVIAEGDNILFPITKRTPVRGGVIVKRKAPALASRPRSLAEALSGVLSEGELALLPSGFDVVGDIAILELPAGLLKKKKVIGNTLLKTFSNLKVAALKTAPVSTEYRVRGVEVVAGEKRTFTIHTEYGCRYRLDVSKDYFSPRLGTERMRVASQVKAGERVLVMFAGVGPYAVLIAKQRSPKEVVAIELNPDAARFMAENASLNKARILSIQGDVRDATPLLGKFDRIVMPLPKDACDFLDVALPALSRNGIVHFYDFAGSPDESARKVASLCKKLGYRIKVLDAVACGSYSPQLGRVCVDLKILGKNK